MSLIFLFPGQGSQVVGMGLDYLRSFPGVASRLEQASERLGVDLGTVLAKGPPKLLAETRLAQPAIFTLSHAIHELLGTRGLLPACTAGHSLGEFGAVTAAGALDFDVALDLVIERGRLMHQANTLVDGGMLAVSGLDTPILSEILGSAGGGVWIANHNAPSQVVLSGLRHGLRAVAERVAARGGRATWLDVAGPYHTPLMRQAAEPFATLIAAAPMRDPHCPVIGNTAAELLRDAAGLRGELSRQMLSGVDWAGTMDRIRPMQPEFLIEVGPGKVMKGLALRNDPALRCLSTGTVRELDDTCRMLERLPCVSS